MGGRVIYVPIASPIHDPDAVRAVNDSIKGSIKDLIHGEQGVTTTVSGVRELGVEGVAAYVAPVLTGGTEHLVLELARKGAPVAVVAHRGQNSLAASLEAISRIRYEGLPAHLLMFGDRGFRESLEVFLRASRAYSGVRGSRVVLVGEPSPWLIYSNEQLGALRKLLNLKFVRVGVDEVVNDAARVSEGEVGEALRRFRGADMVGVGVEDVARAVKVYVALRRVLNRAGARVLTIRCFDMLDYGLTACLALSMLNDEGFTAGCEGDVPSAVTMALLSGVSSRPSFMGNIAWVEGGEVLVAHCTVATKLVANYRLRTHFESGLGVGVEGSLPKGSTVTMARLDALRGVIRAGVGEVVNEGPVTRDACRTQVLVRLKGGLKLVENPMGNHYVITPGDYRRELEVLAGLLNLGYEEV
ncbi:MAG: hypothetical protein B6U73_02850 [Desulfurococcales archaeon ex4484_204]|nr:MAG: hypothetical protein B6U73_02850 [Desulfurococcales archaeon ex4484_204]